MKRLLLLVSLALAELCHGQISTLVNQPVFRAFNANGQPLAGGKLFTYAAGTSTPLAAYADSARTTPLTNPIILDSSGQSCRVGGGCGVFLGLSNYKLILQDASGVEQWSIDNVNGIPSAGNVSSVFGRTGAVIAVSGDYSCGQVTGAVCSLPTLHYQTIQNNTATLAQRSKLNMLSGANVTVSCVDNSGNDSTDCTTDYTPPTVTTDTWFTFNTCTIAQTGNTYQCSGTYSGSPFPLSFTPTIIVCTPQTPGPVSATFNITQASLNSSGFSYSFGQYMGNGTSGAAVGATMMCVIHHP